MTRICMIGIGRTGGEIAKTILEQKNMKLVAAVCTGKSSKTGRDVGEVLGIPSTGVYVYPVEKLEDILKEYKPDVVVDFSTPNATISNAKIVSKLGLDMIIGTTGFSKTDLMRLMVFARRHENGILYAPNITLGVNVMMLLSNIAASILNDYDFQITEVHHKYKKDAPSGTAIKIAAEVEKGLGESGINQKIPINAIRVGGVIGKHELIVAGENDKIEILHESFSRKAFAAGTLRAISFIKGKNGFFEMSDVLELEKVLGNYLESKRKKTEKRTKAIYGIVTKDANSEIAM